MSAIRFARECKGPTNTAYSKAETIIGTPGGWVKIKKNEWKRFSAAYVFMGDEVKRLTEEIKLTDSALKRTRDLLESVLKANKPKSSATTTSLEEKLPDSPPELKRTDTPINYAPLEVVECKDKRESLYSPPQAREDIIRVRIPQISGNEHKLLPSVNLDPECEQFASWEDLSKIPNISESP